MPTGQYVHKRTPPIERFMPKIKLVRTPGQWSFCWIWTGQTTGEGYGRFRADPEKPLVLVHRWAYEHWIGPIPKGKQLDHFKCHNPSCCNPRHVRPATGKENVHNGKTHPAVWTHCKHGHEFTPENTIRRRSVNKSGIYIRRECRQCRSLRGQRA